eukprot:TRINITY_DN5729_c0_g1_i3.p1 TRINITY_DN5729_c0_g1~~TRINITY_DN5729_c0_g1_i3.p1  ORF type:complete len:765 (-),score=93.30 TRINITY_DN5729_c0_g1_i3:21-2315(-)
MALLWSWCELFLVTIVLWCHVGPAESSCIQIGGSAFTPCLPFDPLQNSGAGNQMVSPGFFQCCDCTFSFWIQPNFVCGGTVKQPLFFVGDSGKYSGSNNTLRIYLNLVSDVGPVAVDICDLQSCTLDLTGPYNLNSNLIYFVAVVKKGNQLTIYTYDYSLSSPLYQISYTIPSTCLLVHDEVYQGSRIAFDETLSLTSCQQYFLDTVSYFNTALDADEVNLLITPNWISCGLASSRGTWLFNEAVAPWSPYPGTPAASLNMQWDNPCATYSIATNAVTELPDFITACSFSPVASPNLFDTSGGPFSIDLGASAVPLASIGSFTVTTPFGNCFPNNFMGNVYNCTIPPGVNASLSMDFKVFSGNLLKATFSYSYKLPSISIATDAPFEGGSITIVGSQFGNIAQYVSIMINGVNYPCGISIPHVQLLCSVPSATSIGASAVVPFMLVVGNQFQTYSYLYTSPTPTPSASMTHTMSVSATGSFITPTSSTTHTTSVSTIVAATASITPSIAVSSLSNPPLNTVTLSRTPSSKAIRTTSQQPQPICIGCTVETQKIIFNKKNTNQQLVISIKTGSGSLTGRLTIPAGTFQPGCTLTIEQGDEPKETSKSSSECDKKSNKVVSSLVGLSISKPCKSSDFKHAVLIDLFIKTEDQSKRKACLAFAESNKDWECLSDTQFDDKAYDDVVDVQGKTTHFTTFAVLLQSQDPCHNRWIWITSLAMIGGALVLFIVAVIVRFKSELFRAWLEGYEGKRLTKIVTTTAKKMNSP